MPKQTFITWRQPALRAVVDFACAAYERNGLVDLSRVIIVTPGARAGRRFLELLAEKTDGRNIAPQLATPGDLPERLYQLKRPLADELTQQFAWVEALRGLKEEEIRSIVGQPPPDGDIQAWLALSELIGKVHRELAADLKDFNHVAALPVIQSARETKRWTALATAQQRYLVILDDLRLWDRQTARLVAIEHREPATDCDIFLIGLADMNGTLWAMLQQVADRVHVFIHAPEDLAPRFDEFGVLKAETWEQAPIHLEEHWLRFVDQPADQAAEVVEFVREQAEAGAAAEEIVIGIADESLGSPVRVALDEQGVASRWIGGRTVKETSIARLLSAIADRLESDQTATTCELIRHADVGRWLKSHGLPAGWLAMVDDAVIRYAPRRLGTGKGNDRDLAVTREVARLVDRLLKPLEGLARPMGDLAGPVCEVLQEIYRDREFGADEADRREAQAIEIIRDALQGQAQIPESLAPSTTAAVAIRLALQEASRVLLPPNETPDAVEMVGWLELPLDDAPALVVCGMNDGFVPSSLNSDMFLPNGLREDLGLEDNRRRYARDAYALSVLVHSQRSVRFLSGRHNVLGDPLLPSRLLFATDEKTMAKRIKRAFQPESAAGLASHLPRVSGFRVPRERPGFVVDRLGVTAFRDYIACPYRFYLKHVEKLSSVGDLDGELAASDFGTLIHRALKMWADSDARDATDPAQIQRVIEDSLESVAADFFDEEPLPAVKLQLEQAKFRLKSFAGWQAAHRREGWEVQHDEVQVTRELSLESGRTLQIRGQIDRIDYHPARNEWLIIDYKTGDAALGPAEVHLAGGEWVDLQLPLYRWLSATLEIPGEPRVAYIALGRNPPADPCEIFKPAEWDADQWAQAYWKMFRVAEDVAAGRFWPPSSIAPAFDEFGCIVQEGVFGREEFQ